MQNKENYLKRLFEKIWNKGLSLKLARDKEFI